MTTDDIETQATAWIGGQADYWKRRARDAETTVERLRGELAEEKQDADRWHRRANRMRIKVEQVRAELTQRAEHAEAAAAEWQAACEAHQADGEALMAALERVRALCGRGPGQHNEHQIWIADVIAALDAPSGADSPASGRTGVPRHTETTREAGEAQEAAE